MPLAQSNFGRLFLAVTLLALGLLCAGVCTAQSGGTSGSSSSNSGNGSSGSASNPGKPGTQAGGGQNAAPDDDPNSTRLKIVVLNADGKPVGSASVYLRFNESGGFLRKEKLAEMAFKTNDDGSVKVPAVPVGRVLIQVVGKGLHTYGKWFDVVKDQDPIEIKLEKTVHWY